MPTTDEVREERTFRFGLYHQVEKVKVDKEIQREVLYRDLEDSKRDDEYTKLLIRNEMRLAFA